MDFSEDIDTVNHTKKLIKEAKKMLADIKKSRILAKKTIEESRQCCDETLQYLQKMRSKTIL